MPILNILVFVCFEHVPTLLNGIHLSQINNLQKTQLMEEKKIYGYRSFVHKLHFCKQANASFALGAIEALFVAEKSFVVNQNH